MSSTTYEFGASGPVEPFWQRIHKFFTLPLDKAVLMRIGGLAVACVIALGLFFLGVFGVVLGLAALVAVLVIGARFGFKIIERSSKGFLVPSDYPLSDDDLVSPYLPYKFVAMNIVFGLLLGLMKFVTGGSEFFSLLFWFLLFVVVIPAATMRLVITGSLRAALNPAELVALVQRIGKPYAALAAFVFCADLCRTYGMAALAVAGGVGAGLVGAVGGPKTSLGFGSVALLFFMAAGFWYFTYVICALIGYGMYQYADKLDISVVGPGEQSLRSTATARTVDIKARTRDALIGQMVSAGEIKEAIELLSEDLRERPGDLSLHARFHRLVVAEGSTPRIEDHTDKYLTLLVKSQNWREALELYEEAIARRADWAPRDVATLVPLAQAALRAGKPREAGLLIRGFDKKHPNHPDIPRAYLVGAQIMAEYANKPADATRILEHLVKHYASDPVATEAARYLEVMRRMAK
ncbi:MAG: tetratricopeptide repeat protein [Burkholderiaceae bacterium]